MSAPLPYFPQPGPQEDLLRYKAVPELLWGGSRGGGKTAGLLGDFVSDVGEYKEHWLGVLFRRTYPELEEVIRQSWQFYPQTGATWSEQKKMWSWGNGASLKMRYMEAPRDATRYQGQQFTWLGFDELGNWDVDTGFMQLLACLRSPAAIPHKRVRCTANPGGVGHFWVKERYQIGQYPKGYVLLDDPSGLHRMYIPSRVTDNRILMEADPGYVDRLRAVGSPALVKAWLEGDWNVVAGAYFPEWSEERHVIDPIDPADLPRNWKIYRAYDHGTYHPFCVLWYTYAGTGIPGIPKGTLVILREWYGGNQKGEGLKLSLAEIREGIADRERSFGRKVEPGPADNQIFEEHGGMSIANALAQAGVYFSRSDKARIPGWNQVRLRLKSESLKVCRTCTNVIRTIPLLQHDERKPEDVDTTGDDHCADVVRYSCMAWPVTPEAEKKRPETRDIGTYAELLETVDELTRRVRL